MVDNTYENMEILIVEDSPTQALLLKETLEKHSFSTAVAVDGVNAIELLSHKLPNLVITDIEMPRMNGYELCKSIKIDPKFNSLPVILLTNLTNSLDVIRGIECGADSFLTKPCSINVLLSTIHDVMDNKKLHANQQPGKPYEFIFGGQHHLLQLDQVQVTNLLLSTYANAIQKNLELEQSYTKLNQAHSELKKRSEELKTLNEQKNHLLGMAAHDLRNPLGAIEGYSNWLQGQLSGKIDSRSEKILERINYNSTFMLQLINNLLDISVIESGIVSLHISEVNLPELIKESLIFLQDVAEKKNIKILVHSNPDLLIPPIYCDANKISQVIFNLVGNAIKFSYPESSIELGLQPTEDRIIISVKDHGVGMPKNNKDNLFQPFKGSSLGTAGEKGTGLGLAIVHKIIQEHQGEIWIESEEGKGSCFFVALPLACPPANRHQESNAAMAR